MKPRTPRIRITLELNEFASEDYADVCDELILNDIRYGALGGRLLIVKRTPPMEKERK